MLDSLFICYCCRWKKRKRKNFSIVVTERVRREMSDQVFAKKYENKEMTKKGQKQRRKQNTITNRAEDTQKFQRHIHIVNLFFRKSRRTRRGRVDLQDEKIAPKIQHSEKRKHFMPPLPSPQRDNIHFQRGLSCPQHFLRKHVDTFQRSLNLP